MHGGSSTTFGVQPNTWRLLYGTPNQFVVAAGISLSGGGGDKSHTYTRYSIAAAQHLYQPLGPPGLAFQVNEVAHGMAYPGMVH